ncbi:MAG: hypothetical protein ACPGYP_02265 [Solirubrobacterales bacterium]
MTESQETNDDVAWPSDRYSDFAEKAAWAFVALLFREPKWVHRRVETIGVLSRVDARRSVSVDFTIPEELHEELRLPDAQQWTVPVAVVHRDKLRHFDLRQDSVSVPLLGHVDAFGIAFWMLVQAALLALQTRVGGEPESLDDVVLELINMITDDDSESARTALDDLRLLAGTTSADFELSTEAEIAEWNVRCAQAKKLLGYPVFSYLASLFAANRLLVAIVPTIAGRQIVKYGYDAPLEPDPDSLEPADGEQQAGGSPTVESEVDAGSADDADVDDPSTGEGDEKAAKPGLFARLMLGLDTMLAVTQIFDFPVPSMARAECYHVEVAIPEELTVLGAAIYDRNDSAWYDWENDVNRVSLRASDVSATDRPRLTMAIRPDRHGFPSAAVAISLVTTAVLVAGAWLSPLVTNRASMSVSVLLGMSALFTGLVVRSGEHRLVQHSLRRPRRALFAVALCALTAVITLAFVNCESVQEWVWIGSAGLAGIFTIILLGFWQLARPVNLG